MKIQIQNLKLYPVCPGDKTDAFSCDFYVDDKLAAQVHQSGAGGCHDWQWIDTKCEKILRAEIEKLDLSRLRKQLAPLGVNLGVDVGVLDLFVPGSRAGVPRGRTGGLQTHPRRGSCAFRSVYAAGFG